VNNFFETTESLPSTSSRPAVPHSDVVSPKSEAKEEHLYVPIREIHGVLSKPQKIQDLPSWNSRFKKDLPIQVPAPSLRSSLQNLLNPPVQTFTKRPSSPQSEQDKVVSHSTTAKVVTTKRFKTSSDSSKKSRTYSLRSRQSSVSVFSAVSGKSPSSST